MTHQTYIDRWKVGVALLCCLMLFVACSDTQDRQDTAATGGGSAPSAPPPVEAELPPEQPAEKGGDAVSTSDGLEHIVTAHNKFGLLVHDALVKGRGEDENVFISPLSVSLALSTAYNGARGATASAMADGLQLRDMDLVAVNAAHRALLNVFAAEESALGVRLLIANALWHRDDFPMGRPFLETAARYYDATAQALDFTDPASVDVINDWVREHTEGLIDNLVEKLESDLVTLLVNTVYFKGQWTTPFEANLTADDTFHTADGTGRTVPFMYRDGRFDHRKTANFEAVRLPYGDDGRMAMYVFLPADGVGVEDLASWLAGTDGAGLFTDFTNELGEVRLPRLDVEYKTNLNDVLISLGMGIAFDPGRADFGNMLPGADSERDGGAPADAVSDNLYIGDVIHQSVLKVDEEGTEAAAATSVGVRTTSLPQYAFRFEANRPFLLVIRDDDTEAMLFIGSVVDPS